MGKGFFLRAKVCFVTWCRSEFDDHTEFYEVLRERMPVGTRLFGCKELHRDGKPHYHVSMRFPEEVRWQDALGMFRLCRRDGGRDTKSIRISVLSRGEGEEQFLERTQAYCVKHGNESVFGARFGERDELVLPDGCWRCARCERRLVEELDLVCVCCTDMVVRKKVSTCRWYGTEWLILL